MFKVFEYSRPLFALFTLLFFWLPVSSAEPTSCLKDLCIGQSVVTFNSGSLSGRTGKILQFKSILDSKKKSEVIMAVVLIDEKAMTLSPERLALAEEQTCTPQPRGLCVGKSIYTLVNGVLSRAKILGIKSSEARANSDQVIFRTENNRQVLSSLTSPSPLIAEFQDCEKYIPEEVCQRRTYQNAKGETESLIGIQVLPSTNKVVISSPAQPSIQAISVEQLRQRSSKVTSITSTLKLVNREESSTPETLQIEVFLKSALVFADQTCQKEFLGYGKFIKGLAEVKMKSCSTVNSTEVRAENGESKLVPIRECEAEVNMSCNDGYAEGREKNALLNEPVINVFLK